MAWRGSSPACSLESRLTAFGEVEVDLAELLPAHLYLVHRHTTVVVFGKEVGYGYGILVNDPGHIQVRSQQR